MQKFVLPITLLLLLGIACSDIQELTDFEQIDTSPQFALPLINSTISLQDILEDVDENASLLVDSDGLLRFNYQSDTTTRTSQEIFDVINRSLPPLIPILDTLIGFPVVNTNGIGVSQVIFKEGRLEYSFFNPHDSEIELTFSVLQMLKEGQPLTQSHTVGPNQALPPAIFDLAGVELIPTNDSLFVSYEAYNSDNESVKVQNFFLLQKEVEYSYASGILATSILENDTDTLTFDFADQIEGDIYFEEPKVTITIGNSFGLPANVRVSRFDILTKSGTVLPLESVFVDNGFDFNFPGFDEVGVIKETEFVFDRSNSNLDVIIGAGPVGLIYELDAITNPDEDAAGYLTDESIFEYTIEAEFPLHGTIRDLVRRDTQELNLNLNDFEAVEELEFKIVTENGIPLGADAQIYFATETQVIDSLFSDGKSSIIQSASVDGLGNVSKSATQINFVPISKNRLLNIETADRIYIETVFNTNQERGISVRVTNDQTLGIRMGVKAQY